MKSINNTRPILEINLNHLKWNYSFIKNYVGTDVSCAAVLKANAYGLGSKYVFKALKELNCIDFYFAYVEEALEVKELMDGTENIYILSPQSEYEASEIIQNNFIPVLNSIEEIEFYKKKAQAQAIKPRVVLHFDTGLNRLGLNFSDTSLINVENLNVHHVMTHLIAAEELDVEYNKLQYNQTLELQKHFAGTKISLANSAGIFLGKEYHFDQVRSGSLIYGINKPTFTVVPLKPVVYIWGKVIQIKEVNTGDSISYGGNFIAKENMRIATIALGYADGYHRILSNRSYCYFKEYELPVVGNVTMDYIMVDITKVPSSLLKNLDYVEVAGENITIDRLAKYAKTVSHEMLTSLGYSEILTSLGKRFNRVYIS